MPEFMKAPGIGDSVSEALGPGFYDNDVNVTNLRNQKQHEIYKKTHVEQWHKDLFKEDKKKNPD